MRWFDYLQAYKLFRILEGSGLNIFRNSGHCSNAFVVCRNLPRQMFLLRRYLVALGPLRLTVIPLTRFSKVVRGLRIRFFWNMSLYFWVLMLWITIVPSPSESSLPIFRKVKMTCPWSPRHTSKLQFHRCVYASSHVFDIWNLTMIDQRMINFIWLLSVHFSCEYF